MQCVDLGGRRIIKKIFFKQKTAYEIMPSLVGSEMCIRDSSFAENLPVSANIIATLYGALRHFPQNDCLVVSLDHEICFDLVTKEGVYRGGATFPSPYAKQKPLSSIGESLSAQNTIGNYYGTLGAIERIIFEIKQEAEHPGSVQVLATSSEPFAEMTQDLQEWVDCIDPHLTLIGLHEIQKEHLLTKEKSL